METKNIGIEVKNPDRTCNDKKCPFHGDLKLHGRTFSGIITKVDLNKSATIEFNHFHYIPKFERYEKRITRIRAHNPSCISAKVGDYATIVETRKISKTKNFVIVEVIKNESS